MGLLDWDRKEEWEEEEEGGGDGLRLATTKSPVKQPTETSRGTNSSFCGGYNYSSEREIVIQCLGSCYKVCKCTDVCIHLYVWILIAVPDSCKPYREVSSDNHL